MKCTICGVIKYQSVFRPRSHVLALTFTTGALPRDVCQSGVDRGAHGGGYAAGGRTIVWCAALGVPSQLPAVPWRRWPRAAWSVAAPSTTAFAPGCTPRLSKTSTSSKASPSAKRYTRCRKAARHGNPAFFPLASLCTAVPAPMLGKFNFHAQFVARLGQRSHSI